MAVGGRGIVAAIVLPGLLDSYIEGTGLAVVGEPNAVALTAIFSTRCCPSARVRVSPPCGAGDRHFTPCAARPSSGSRWCPGPSRAREPFYPRQDDIPNAIRPVTTLLPVTFCDSPGPSARG